ncbi:hypothetical protein FCIRC_5243 [Fusarium circinatum]|uniref:Uncharacterized protein n=1 Tax=Fusarium circinatum TaxID=48490 RepID=A0A8H5U5X7_FUSCI|nr:hypothetical protein FCIRC_5243 [Fusarium circinatum]
MRGFIPLLLALSASYTTVIALPQPRIVHRDTTAKPKYSVVPLEPGDDDPASGDLGGGNGDGNGNGGSSTGSGGSSSDNDGDGVVTVIRTVTQKPVTKVVTQTEKPSIVTAPGKTVTKAVPTTVSIINMDDEPVTETVTVPHPVPKPTSTQQPGTTTDKRKPIAQSTTDLSSAAAPGVTSQPSPQPQPQLQPLPQSEPEPGPESPTNVEEPQTAETSSTTCITDYAPPVETVAKPPPIIESPAPVLEPTTLLTQTSESAGAPEQTERPTPDAPVAPIPSQGTYVESQATQDHSWSTAAVPYEPPVAPTTLITLTTTTTSITETSTPESSSASKTHDNGAWHTSYPAWNGTALAI